MSNEQRVTFRLPQELAERLKALSDQKGTSQAHIIRDVLYRYLERLF